MDKNVERLIQLLDKDTMDKCQETALWLKRFSKAQNVSEELLQAASICDIGKMYISKSILNKEGRLTDSELEIVKMHPYFGYQICIENGIDKRIAEIILFHHGKNPFHLQAIPAPNREIVAEAKILYTIDVYQALTNEKAYRNALDNEAAVNILNNEQSRYCCFDDDAINFLKNASNTF